MPNHDSSRDHDSTRDHEHSSKAGAVLWRLIMMAGMAVGGGWGMTTWMEFRHATAWTGRLHAFEAVVRAPCAGRIEKLSANAGDVVPTGRLLGSIADSERERRCEGARQRVAALEQQLAEAVAKAEVDLAWRLRSIETERHETRLKQAGYLKSKFDSELRQQALDERPSPSESAEPSKKIAPARFLVPVARDESSEPAETSFSARLQREANVNATEVAAAQVALCDRQLERLDKLALELPQRVRRAAGVETLESLLATARSELEQIEKRPAAIDVNSTEYGTLGRWEKRVGDKVAEGEPLVTQFDEDRRYVLVHVPSQQAAEFTEKTRVSLVFPGKLKRKGVVAPLPRQTHDAAANEKTLASADAAFVAIRIEATDRLWPEAPIGSAVEVKLAR